MVRDEAAEIVGNLNFIQYRVIRWKLILWSYMEICPRVNWKQVV